MVSQALSELLWRDFFRFTSKKYASLPLDKQHSSSCAPVANSDDAAAAAAAAAACTPAMHAPQPMRQLAYA